MPGLLWWFLFGLRPKLMTLWCAKAPLLCQVQHIFFLDRWVVFAESDRFDFLSFVTQDLAGAWAVFFPLLALLFQKSLNKGEFKHTLVGYGAFLQAVCWNGSLNEIARFLVQRPRPFVYHDPASFGSIPANYTSFYSGHTSFAGVCAGFLWMQLLESRTRRPLFLAGNSIAALLVGLTGLFRVLAGRHFLTDVVVGAVVGAFVGVFLKVIWHRPIESP